MVLPLVIIKLQLERTVLVMRNIQNFCDNLNFLVVVAAFGTQTAFIRTFRVDVVNGIAKEENFFRRRVRPTQNSFLVDATEG